MIKFADRGSMSELCKWAVIPRSSQYYKSSPGPRGMKASTHTLKGKQKVPNEDVVEQIRRILGQDYCVYGYHIMTSELRGLGFTINDKKVYRLMDESKLLWGKRIHTKGKRQFVKFRRIEAKRPMEYLCLDIKYVYVRGENRWCYQLAILDVFSRMVIGYLFQPSLRQNDVIAIMRNLHLRFGLKGVIIRNDNGSQFIAHRVRQALQDMEARQEFTHVATPEENAYIEAFHSIQQRELMDRFTFTSFADARRHIEEYIHWYNHVRRHGQIGRITPAQKWAQGWTCSPVRPPFTQGGQGMSRPADAFENWMKNQPLRTSLDIPERMDYLCLTGEQEKVELCQNSFSKTVQRIGG